LVDQVFLDGQAAAHLVESRCEIAYFVSRRDGDRDVVVTRADSLGAGLEAPDGAHEDLGQRDRQQTDQEYHARSHQHHGLGERRLFGERLGRVDLGYDRPVQFGVLDHQGCVGLKGIVAEVVGRDQGSGLALLGVLGGW